MLTVDMAIENAQARQNRTYVIVQRETGRFFVFRGSDPKYSGEYPDAKVFTNFSEAKCCADGERAYCNGGYHYDVVRNYGLSEQETVYTA